MSRNFKDIVKDFQHALNISYQNTRNIVKVSERYLAELADAEQSGGGGVNYSTDEQDTGLTWIDGKKIYQKTLDVTPASLNEWSNVGALGVDALVDISTIAARTIDSTTYLYAGGGSIRPEYSADYFVSVRHASGYIQLYINGYTGIDKVYITVKYTKAS